MNYHVALIQLPLVQEHSNEKVLSPADVLRVCADIAGLAQESIHLLALNVKHLLINRHMVSLGGTNFAPACAKEIFRAALTDGAAGIVLAHNHPSGDPAPSKEDVEVTQKLILGGKILGITVLDHVIIGRAVEPTDGGAGHPAYISLRESGLCKFD